MGFGHRHLWGPLFCLLQKPFDEKKKRFSLEIRNFSFNCTSDSLLSLTPFQHIFSWTNRLFNFINYHVGQQQNTNKNKFINKAFGLFNLIILSLLHIQFHFIDVDSHSSSHGFTKTANFCLHLVLKWAFPQPYHCVLVQRKSSYSLTLQTRSFKILTLAFQTHS